MEKYDIHVCLVSEQAAANLLPILDSNLIPESAIFLVSNAMSKEAEYLARSFTQKKVKVTQFKLS